MSCLGQVWYCNDPQLTHDHWVYVVVSEDSRYVTLLMLVASHEFCGTTIRMATGFVESNDPSWRIA